MEQSCTRFFVEPKGNVIETNRQIAEFLGFQDDDVQTHVWCKGLKYPRRMWEATLEDCKSIVEAGVKVSVWKMDASERRAERVRWLRKPRKNVTRKKKTRQRKPPPEF